MGSISLNIPQAGLPNSTQDPLVASDFTTLQTWANGGIDGNNLSPAGAQAAGMNQSGQTVKGAVNIPTSESTSSPTYTTLATPDQLTGIVLPTNGLIAVWYQATWRESVAGAADASIFLNGNQVTIAAGTGPSGQGTGVSDNGVANVNRPLATSSAGLSSGALSSSQYSGDSTTGQIISAGAVGGPCYIFAPAGTYTVSVRFTVTLGSVTAANRKLWVQALSFV